MSMPQWLHAAFETYVRRRLAQCMRKLTVACGREWDYSTLHAAELTGLSSFQKPWKPPRYATGPNFASEICSVSTFFHLWEVVQIFQRESIYCSKISSRGSLFIEKLVPGGANFGGPFLPWQSHADVMMTLPVNKKKIVNNPLVT